MLCDYLFTFKPESRVNGTNRLRKATCQNFPFLFSYQENIDKDQPEQCVNKNKLKLNITLNKMR